MKLSMPGSILKRIEQHAIASYPHEGAGVLLGTVRSGLVVIENLLPMENTFEESLRNRRYQIDAQSMMQAELAAEEQELEVVGIFHSHPDHPARPSEYDREHSLPWYAYIITSVNNGIAGESRAWRLRDDREAFHELRLLFTPNEEQE